jgi:molybdopterin synthase catalytic subunit/molybdopterin converting factor small subunit
VLLFGPLRTSAGVRELRVRECASVRDVWAALVHAHPRAADHAEGVRAARNEEYCDWEAPVHRGDTVAFIPPVAGGRTDGDAVRASVTEQPIDAGAVIAAAGSPHDGAVASFIGTVRGENGDVTGLDYEAYVPMAESEMRRIAGALHARGGISSIVMVHRTGELAVGDVSVVIAVAAPHRDAALKACRDAIEMLKHDVPIWKREHRLEGARWVREEIAP